MTCIKGFKAIILLQVWPGIQSTLRSCTSCYLWKKGRSCRGSIYVQQWFIIFSRNNLSPSWKNYITKIRNGSGSNLQTLKEWNSSLFLNIHTLLRIAFTLPVTSCQCEWSCSVSRRLSDYMTSTMGQNRLPGNTSCFIEHSMRPCYWFGPGS